MIAKTPVPILTMADTPAPELSRKQTEVTVVVPIRNPDTGFKSRSFRYAGKIDELQLTKVIDYKSTSDPSLYIFRQTLQYQPELYAWAAEQQFGVKVTEIEYRLVKTPTIRLCTKDEQLTSHPNIVVDHAATRQAYEDRVFEWLHDDTKKLVPHTLLVTPPRRKAAMRYLWQCSKRVLQCRRDGWWLTNPKACNEFNRRCEHQDLCEVIADGGDYRDLIDGEQFRIVDNSHPELGDWGKDGGLLTHTSMGVLTNCECQYDFMFEQCIRKGSEPLDARWLGSAMHAGLDAFATGGQEAAFAAIDDWEAENPILGLDAATLKDQQIARARAMVRAAANKWSVNDEGN